MMPASEAISNPNEHDCAVDAAAVVRDLLRADVARLRLAAGAAQVRDHPQSALQLEQA